MEKPWKDLTNSAKDIVINFFVQSLKVAVFNKTTELSDPVLVFEMENVLYKSNETHSSVLCNRKSKSESVFSNKSY